MLLDISLDSTATLPPMKGTHANITSPSCQLIIKPVTSSATPGATSSSLNQKRSHLFIRLCSPSDMPSHVMCAFVHSNGNRKAQKNCHAGREPPTKNLSVASQVSPIIWCSHRHYTIGMKLHRPSPLEGISTSSGTATAAAAATTVAAAAANFFTAGQIGQGRVS